MAECQHALLEKRNKKLKVRAAKEHEKTRLIASIFDKNDKHLPTSTELQIYSNTEIATGSRNDIN